MLTDNQKSVIENRWLRKENGVVVESIDGMFDRVTNTIAKNEDDVKLYREYLSEFRFVLNTPTYTGAGTGLGQLSACFVLELKDDMGKEDHGIFDTLRRAALIQQSGGGVGFDFSPLRPKNSIVKSSGGFATGPIGFMKVFNVAFDEISQGGIRRSANIAILRVDHPDILEFIECKTKDKVLSNFNISVAITNEFMQAVENDADFDLRFDGKVYKTVRARDILDKIVYHAWKNGEPGIVFIDRMNDDNPLPNKGKYTTCNPCQPGFATVLTPDGIRTFDDIDVGSVIWSGREWTRVINKLQTGIKHVNLYLSDVGYFLGTNNHRLVICNTWKEGNFSIDKKDADYVYRDGDYVIGQEVELDKNTYYGTIKNVMYMGKYPVYDITVECPEHTYWTGGLIVSNCGEKPLHFNESCNLGHSNMSFYGTNGVMDWERLAQDIRIEVRMLNDVLDANKYVTALPELRDMALSSRPIGLGVMGLADLLFDLKIRYGSEEAVSFAYQLEEFNRFVAMQESVELAKKYGPFPLIQGSIYDRHNFRFALPDRPGWIKPFNFGMPELDWEGLIRDIKTYGIRNSTVLTIAPTGTTGTAAGVEGYGCEPVFALAYKRNMRMLDGSNQEMYYTSKSLEKYGLSQDILKQIQSKGSLQSLDVSPELKWVYVTASDITPCEHVKMQAALQVWNDSSISKTVNLPASAKEQDVKDVYLLAYKLGCKGITVYRDSSRDNQVLEVCTTCDSNPIPAFVL